MPTAPRSRTADAFEPATPAARTTARSRTKGPAAPVGPFTGFGEGGMAFFRTLDEEQDRDWFHAHKDEYTQLWHAPMQSLLAHLSTSLKDVYPTIGEAIPKVFRIQRDVRFSDDRTPYKTFVAGTIPVRPPRRGETDVPGLYVQLGLETFAAGGRWMLAGDALARFRDAVAHAKHGAELQDAVGALLANGFTTSAHESLKRVPPPYATDHPRGDLLRRKGLAVVLPTVPEELANDRALGDWFTDRFRQLAPVIHWLDRHAT